MLTPPEAEPGAELRNFPSLRNLYGPSTAASNAGTRLLIGPQLRTMMKAPSLGASVYRASSVVPDEPAS